MVDDTTKKVLKKSQEFLQYQGHSDIQITAVNSTNQSETFLFSTYNPLYSTDQKFVLKLFTQKYRFNSTRAIQEEFTALEKFHKALQATNLHQRITCPLPVTTFESDQAYLMTYIQGQSLEAAWRQADINTKEIARRLVDGLSIFYKEVRSIYADFHPGNIIISPNNQVGFIDPTIPEPFFYSFSNFTHYPYCVDLGYWLNLVSITSAKLLYTGQQKVCLRRWDFTTQLLAAVITNLTLQQHESFLLETRNIALAHLRYLTREKFLNGILHYLVSRQIAIYLTASVKIDAALKLPQIALYEHTN